VSAKSGIEWTDATWNPVVGCSAVSPGCDHCYAAKEVSGRLSTNPVYAGLAEHGVFTGEVRCIPERLDQPLHWTRKPKRIFVNSMSDLFHPDVMTCLHEGQPFLAHVVARMVAAEQHTFQVLTKRPQLMARILRHPRFKLDVNSILLNLGHPVMPGGMSEPETPWPKHIWWGTSIESDNYTFRANWLRHTPAAVRFLSLEPLLGPLPSLHLTDIDWVIVGGESGEAARPMDPNWARRVRDQAVALGVPFLFKQHGTWVTDAELDLQSHEDHERYTNQPMWHRDAPWDPDELIWRWRGKAPFRTLDGRLWDEYPA
jgi:protein gp37